MAIDITEPKKHPRDDSSGSSSSTNTIVKGPAENKRKLHPQVLPEGEVELRDAWSFGVDWPGVLWIVAIHVGACFAPFVYSWQAAVLTAVLCWFFGSIGICLGFHRYLTHGSFQTTKFMRRVFAVVGNLAGEGSVLTWVANHRKHHVFSDKVGDPHSPRDGGLWSHMLWFMPNFGSEWHKKLTERWVPDLLRDPVMRFLHVAFLPLQFVMGGLLWGVGYAVGGTSYMGWSFLVWGLFVRMLYVFHVTWFVNSATHMWGYRNYETSDDSRNLWWVGLLAFGEGWHNNHHAFQRMAKAGHKWWELDPTYWVILAMEKVGLAWNVVKDPPAHGRPD